MNPGFASTSVVVDKIFAAPKDTRALNMSFGPSGDIFVTGRANTLLNRGNYWAIRHSQDGLKWETLDMLSGDDFNASFSTSVYVNDQGVIFAGGSVGKDPKRHCDWNIRRSSDNGNSWQKVDEVKEESSEDPNEILASYRIVPKSIQSDKFGNLYAFGMDSYGAELPHPTALVRKSVDGGDHWLTTFETHATMSTYASEMFVTPEGEIYLVGASLVDLKTPEKKIQWSVLSSHDQGESFQEIDSMPQTYSPFESSALGVVVDKQGVIYVSGVKADKAEKNIQIGHALVRQSRDNGKTWKTILDYPRQSVELASGALATLIDRNGNLNVVIAGALKFSGWTLARSTDNGATWTFEEFDDIQDVYGAKIAPDGKIYVYGEIVDKDGTHYWGVSMVQTDSK